MGGPLTMLCTMQADDPITRGNGAFISNTKLAVAELAICTSFLAFAQSVRLHVHVVCREHTLLNALIVAADLGCEK